MQAPAVVFPGPERVEIREMELPEPGPDQVGVRTVYSGVSQGTERWALTGRYDGFGDSPSDCYPCSPGYQAAGVVDVVGSEVTDLSVGDHVFLPGTRFLDPSHRYPGPCMASHSGYLVASRSDVTRVAPGVDLAAASLYHMAGVARHGVRLVKVQPGELVVVIGLGMIGQMSAQAARRAGARVIATDLIPLRVRAAAEHSADRVVADGERLEDVIREEASAGADVVIDTTGDHRIFDRCLGVVRREGRIAMQGYYPDPITIDFHRTHLVRATVTFPCGWDDELNGELADDMAAGRHVAIGPLITHRVPYREARSAYALVLEHPERSLGMVLAWDSASGDISSA
jgi:2-desacetyl-2-hydroxyethyl bacteriochlorophyllide A dehydrogenase